MITPLYASILTFVLIFLAMNVVKIRRNNRISMGDGGNAELMTAMRMHGNFVETAPWALLLMFLIEYQDGNVFALHTMGLVFLTGRLLHLYALKNSVLPLRVAGMLMTFLVFGIGAIYNLYLAFTVGV